MSTTTADSPRLLTAEEFARLPDNGMLTELVRGQVITMPPPYSYHGIVCGNVYSLIREHVRKHKLGRVLSNDSGVITERSPDTVRGADVCFYSSARLPPEPFPKDEYFSAMPDLVFEMTSPSDRMSEVLEKVKEYLAAGVTVVCVLNGKAESATVYRLNQEREEIAPEGELTFPDILPGFRAPLQDIFE